MIESVYLKADGGSVIEFSVPLTRAIFEQFVRGQLVEVNRDGTPVGPHGTRPIESQPWYGSDLDAWRTWIVANHGATVEQVRDLGRRELEGHLVSGAGGGNPALRP